MIKHNDHYPYVRGIIAGVGFKREIIPYKWKSRNRGISRNNLLSLVDQALNGIFSFTSAPLRLCSVFGIMLSAVSILYAIYSVFYTIIYAGSSVRGIPTIISALFFFSGVQLFSIGMLGEYITAIHFQVRRGQGVVERETINISQELNKIESNIEFIHTRPTPALNLISKLEKNKIIGLGK